MTVALMATLMAVLRRIGNQSLQPLVSLSRMPQALLLLTSLHLFLRTEGIFSFLSAVSSVCCCCSGC